MVPDTTTDEWYRLIGRFVVSFEHACQAATLFIHFYLPGHSQDEQQLKATLLKCLRAQQLHDVARAFLERSGELTPPRAQLLDDFRDLIARRNEIVHSPWTFGGDDPFDPDAVKAKVLSRKLKGEAWTERKLTADEAQSAIDRAHIVDEGFQELLQLCFSAKRMAAAAASAQDFLEEQPGPGS